MLKNMERALNLYPKQSIIHSFIYEKLSSKNCKILSKYNHTNILRYEDVRLVLLRHTIPEKHHQAFLKEMESLGMIKRKDKQNIEIL